MMDSSATPYRNASLLNHFFASPEEPVAAPGTAWEQMAGRYDVRHMSVEELARMAADLYEAGIIPFEDLTSLVPFEFSWNTDTLKTAPAEPRNWVAEYRMRVDFGHSERPEMMCRLLGHLERLEHLRHGKAR